MIIVKKWTYVILLLLVSAILGKLFWPHPSIANLRNQPGPILVLGDSISAGTGSESHQGYVALLQSRLGVELINAGIPGDTTARGLMRLQRDVLERKPALVLVELGGNDFLQKVDSQETRTNLERIITAIQAQGAAVILLGMRGGIFSDRSAGMYAELATKYHTGFVANIMAGVWDNPALKADPIHPNDAGYQKVADRVEPELRYCLVKMERLAR